MHFPPLKLALHSLGAGYTTRSKAFGLFVVVGALLFLFNFNVFAASVTEAYSAKENFPVGTLVSVSKQDPTFVEKTNLNNAVRMAGVITTQNDGLVTLSGDDKVYVASAGEAKVLVTNRGGNIEVGDLLGPSQVNGVAQKVGSEDTAAVLGVALTAFHGTPEQKQNVDGEDIEIGLVAVRILLTDSPGANEGMSFLERIGLSVTGSQVSSSRVIVAGLAFLAGMFVSGVLLFSSIKGTFQSLGRNPMASKSIFSGLIHITILAAAVLLVGSLAGYIIMVI